MIPLMKKSAYLMLLAVVSVLAACASPPPEADLVIRNARLLVGDGTVVSTAVVVVDDGLIVAVGHEVGDWQGRVEIDAAGKTVLPGLIDTHVHLLAMASESAESVARYRQQQLPSVLADFLTRGVTTVRSTGDPLPAITEVRIAGDLPEAFFRRAGAAGIHIGHAPLDRCGDLGLQLRVVFVVQLFMHGS